MWWDGATWADDPGQSHYEDNFAMQIWAPGAGYTPGLFVGRTGVMTNVSEFSYDIYNYDSGQPWKWIQSQLTWRPMPPDTLAAPSGYEVEWFYEPDISWSDYTGWGSFSGWEEYDGWLSGWPGGGTPPEIWWEEGLWAAWGTYWADELWWEESGWRIGESDGWTGAFADDGDPLDAIVENELQGDGWMHTTYYFEVEPNPDLEFIGLFFTDLIAVDQVVIDTICIPEPITISLLGLGGLVLIRRRKR